MWRSFALASSQLELKHVLKAGQSFRWTITPLQDATEEYSLCLPDRLLLLKQTPSQLHYQAIFPGSRHPSPQSDTLPWITDYFQLDVDLVHLESTWSATDPVYQLGKQNGTLLPGVRVLNQDPWECLFSFICSANNNIKRITQMVQSAAEHFSPPLLTHAERAYHPFPPPSAFIHPSTPGVLRTLGFGYRAEYIHRTALALVDSGRCPLEYLQSLRDRPTGEAREALLELTGVGPKVADCVLLMSLGKKEVVPVDVHVVGIAERLYGMKKRSGKGMTKDMYLATQRKLTDVWGDWAGWTQAVLFASDLPFLMASVANPTANPMANVPGPVKIKPIKDSVLKPTLLTDTFKATKLPSQPAKRQVAHLETTAKKEEDTVLAVPLEADSLAERVKRKRRKADI